MADTFDTARTAFLLVDPYNDFFAADGKIYPLVEEVADAVGLHQHITELLGAARAAGMLIVIAPHRRYHAGDLEGWLRPGPVQQRLLEKQLYAAGAKGGDWYPDFAPQAGDVVATEHWGMSGFAQTDLDQQLRQHGIEHVILAGLTAPGCVEGTGRWAMELGYAVTLAKDATAAFSKEWMHAAVELNGPLYAEVLATADVLIRIKNLMRTNDNGTCNRAREFHRPRRARTGASRRAPRDDRRTAPRVPRPGVRMADAAGGRLVAGRDPVGELRGRRVFGKARDRDPGSG